MTAGKRYRLVCKCTRCGARVRLGWTYQAIPAQPHCLVTGTHVCEPGELGILEVIGMDEERTGEKDND